MPHAESHRKRFGSLGKSLNAALVKCVRIYGFTYEDQNIYLRERKGEK